MEINLHEEERLKRLRNFARILQDKKESLQKQKDMTEKLIAEYNGYLTAINVLQNEITEQAGGINIFEEKKKTASNDGQSSKKDASVDITYEVIKNYLDSWSKSNRAKFSE